jgi:hypothetical protein
MNKAIDLALKRLPSVSTRMPAKKDNPWAVRAAQVVGDIVSGPAPCNGNLVIEHHLRRAYREGRAAGIKEAAQLTVLEIQGKRVETGITQRIRALARRRKS